MAFDFTPSKPLDTQLLTTTSGATPIEWLMLGKDGFNAAGKGKWIEMQGVQWKSFMLRAHGSPHNGAIGAGSVEIHVANELDPVDADANTKFKLIGTLNAGAPSLEFEAPWRYVRAEVKVAGTPIMQVDFHAIGV